jgi:hypothetical protein
VPVHEKVRHDADAGGGALLGAGLHADLRRVAGGEQVQEAGRDPLLLAPPQLQCGIKAGFAVSILPSNCLGSRGDSRASEEEVQKC